jgi:U3 small nucleolar RNA-associated protein 13
MPSVSDLKKSFSILRTLDSIYTGGKVQLLSDGQRLLCTDGDKVHLIHTTSGEKISFGSDDDAVTCFASTKEFLITSSSSLLLRVYCYSDSNVSAWKAHEAPVLVMDTDPTGTLVATGSADSTVKVWDIRKGYCTHNFKGHAGIITALAFHPDPDLLNLCSGSLDSRIKVWDLKTKSEKYNLDGHVSAVRGLDFSSGGDVLVSGGRDKVLISWDLSNGQVLNTIPVFESIEDVKVVKSNASDLAVCTGGELGIVKLWDMVSGSCVDQTNSDFPINYTITSLLYCEETSEIVGVTSDQNLLFYSTANFQPTRQIAGFNEEIIEASFLGNESSKLAVATNTEHIRIYELGSAFCEILYGHSDMIMSMNKSSDGKLLISGSKDNSALIWKMNPSTSRFSIAGKCVGHTETVSAVSFSHKNPLFVITASHDSTLKFWDLGNTENEKISPKARYTIKAHSKDIQSVAVAPNDRVYASAALDKTAKIWSADDGSLLGTLTGHKRGIWCVRFSPSDQIVATSSTDKTIKLWSLKDFSCIRTFEGHLNSVLHVEFLTGGTQIASSGSDGLVKIWNIKEQECVTTLDNHEDKVIFIL